MAAKIQKEGVSKLKSCIILSLATLKNFSDYLLKYGQKSEATKNLLSYAGKEILHCGMTACKAYQYFDTPSLLS